MARVLGAGLVISSGSSPDSIALARASGADHVFNYKSDDVGAEIAVLTHGEGADLVFDATYSDPGFVNTARMVRRGGIWSVLGVGPGQDDPDDRDNQPGERDPGGSRRALR